MIYANDLPYSSEETDPLTALHTTLAFAVDDWSETRAKAWIWGIVCGWDDESIAELAPKFRWSDDAIARLRRLHVRFKAIDKEAGNG